MNPTIIKQFWLSSWEVRLGGIALLIAGFTAGDIAPYITLLPGDTETGIESLVLKYWGWITMGIMWLLRITKTSTKLVLNPKDADTPEVIAAAKEAAKPMPSPAKIAEAKAVLEKVAGAQNPKTF